MKKWNVLNGIAVVVVGALLPQVTLGDYVGPYNGSGFTSKLSDASSLVSPLNAGLRAASSSSPNDSLQDIADRNRQETDALIDKLSKSGITKEKELELRQQGRSLEQDIEKDQKVRDAFELLGVQKQKEASDKTKAGLAKTAKLPSAKAVNGADLDTSSLGKACRNGVDFSDFSALAKFLGTEPFKNFKTNYTAFLDKKSKEAEEKLVGKIKSLKKLFDGRAEKQAQKDFQANIQSAKADDFVKKAEDGEYSEDKRLKSWEQKIGKLEQDRQESHKGLNDFLFDQVLPTLISGKKNEAEFVAMKTQTAQLLSNTLATTHDAIQRSAKQLEENCKKKAREIGTDSLAPGTLTTQIYAALASSQSLVSAANNMLAGFNYYRNNLNCTSATDNLEQLYGQSSQLSQQIAALNEIQDPPAFLDALSNVVGNMDQANAQVGNVVKPAMDSCKHVENEFEALSKKRDEAQQVVQQINGGGQSPQAGGQSSQPSSNAVARGSKKGGAFGFGGRGAHGGRGGDATL